MLDDIKRDIDLIMAEKCNQVKYKLNINRDTQYNIYYDIYTHDEEKYFFIKLEENTCSAPFYYTRSYTINDLHYLHIMFKGFEKYNFEEFLIYFKDLFDNKKISISFIDRNEERIKMQLDTIYFSKKIKIDFELYRAIIPTQKDQKMIELYYSNKKKLMMLKQMKDYLRKNEGTQNEKQKIDTILKIFNNYTIPGLERKKKKFMESFICDNLRSKYIINEKNKFGIFLNLKNNYDVDWVQNKYKLVYDEEYSNLKYAEIKYPNYDIDKGQNGDFIIRFNKDDVKPGYKYVCNLVLYIDNKKMDNSYITLNIRYK